VRSQQLSTYEVVNPATGLLEAEYPSADGDEIENLLERSARAYDGWRRTTLPERAAVLNRMAELHVERAPELAALVTREMGKTTREAVGELEYTADIYRYYAEHGPQLLADEPLASESEGTALIRKSPIGSLLGIMPWNFPYYQVARFAGPNLMAGNTIVLKPAPQCPESALAIAELFSDAGLAVDAYLNVFATNDQVADMIADSRVRGVSVTGSERAGTAVAAAAGQHLKKVVLELGGSDPFIVLDTADVTRVVQDAVAARMENAGQACNAAKRFIVVDSLYDEFLEQFVQRWPARRPVTPRTRRRPTGHWSPKTPHAD
jgi:succinate-semialdehyde dehydrogenase/glutarate-semialdehyde dehydrogenase